MPLALADGYTGWIPDLALATLLKHADKAWCRCCYLIRWLKPMAMI